MPSLAELTDNEPQPALSQFNASVGSRVDNILNKLTGANGQQRYQLWPEKVIRDGLTAAGDTLAGNVPQWTVDKDTGEVHTSPQMIEKAQEISALAGTGGLAGADATLGSTAFLRPALKYKDKIYKGKEGQQHQDVIPKELYPEFEQMAMNGEDISHYNFGFMNHKGQFLDREKALKYAIDEGLIDPHAGQYGALTSTLMADSSKPGVAIESLIKAKQNGFPKVLKTNRDIADYIDTHSPKYVDKELIEDNYHGARGELKSFKLDELKEGDKDHNIRNLKKENAYVKKPTDTMPPIVVDNGIIMDGNHRFRAMKAKGEKEILGYDILADSSKPGIVIEAMGKIKGKSRQELERMNIDDLDRAAYGYAAGDKTTLNPKDISIIYKDDLLNPQDKFKNGGMDWVKSVDHSEPVKVSVNQNGKITLEDGHHRWFAADKLNKPLQVEFERIKGKPIEKLLNSDLHQKLIKEENQK